MLEDYRKLKTLVETQRKALESGDPRKLEALTAQIGVAIDRIGQYSGTFDSLPPESREAVRKLIEELQDELSRSLEAWQKFLGSSRQDVESLQATRRYFSSLQTKSASGRRFSVSG